MKLVKTGLMAALLSICGIALADHTHYMGTDIHWKSTSIKGSEKNLLSKRGLGANAYYGIRFDNTWGIEGGMHAHKRKFKESSTRTRCMHATLVGQYALSPENGLDLIGGIGVSHLKFNGFQPDVKIVDSSKMLPRVMAGLEYAVCESIKLRTTFMYDIPLTTKAKAYKPNGNYGVTFGLVFML